MSIQKKRIKLNEKYKDWIILGLILVVALLFRLYKINTPLADYHSWRQVDTAAVARNFVGGEFNLLQPKYDDLSNVQSGSENPQGYRMVEFPAYNAIFAFLYKTFPITSLEIWGRLTSIFFSLIVISSIYILLSKEVNRFSAVIAGIIYATMPFFVYFSRVVLPESTALGFTFLSILTSYYFLQTNKKSKEFSLLLLSAVFFALGLLIKPTVAFFGLAHVYIFFKKYKISALKKVYPYLFFALVVLPFALWRNYIQNYPEGIPKVDTLITLVNTYQGKQNIFFRPSFFRWVFFERINNLILGGFLTAFFILGVFVKNRKYLLTSILISSLAYLFVFQGGNVQHEYYQVLIFPALAIFTALGINFVKKNYKDFVHPALAVLGIVAIYLFSFYVSYFRVKDFYNYSDDTVKMANILKDLTSKEDLIVTDSLGDTTLLYLAERRGAPAVYKDLPSLRDTGYKFFLTANQPVIDSLKQEGLFEIVFESEKFAIFRLL